ncbi:hypothetical protein BLA6863_07570 [Burkholderia lata]|uniref:Uncharacterized protein n=1 Tax=Burkholderia lata (strain ATCC 17760 / DSM 23089 / LMG 22485 / NCIMB 9086 / R18194 / 383) TaxID=482957 RepID=A0A6P2SVT6_BURL3|nr:hypothetical protein BLA6863_07570 [Burkholderia lata]
MCSDGAWLNGLSKPISSVNSAPATPPASGRSNPKRSGHAMKHATEISCTVNSRFT